MARCRVPRALLAESPVLAPEPAQALEEWVRAGGLLFAATRTGETRRPVVRPGRVARAPLPVGRRSSKLLVRTLEGEAPAHWLLKVGSEGDDEWLFGKWFGRERGAEWASIPGAQKRWTGAQAGIYLPVGTRPNISSGCAAMSRPMRSRKARASCESGARASLGSTAPG